MFLEIYFFWIVRFVGVQLFLAFFNNPLYFCGVGCELLSSISDFIYFSLFSWWILLEARQFHPFKEPALSFADLFYVFLFPMLFTSALFMISFLLFTSGFVCSSFPSSFRCKFRIFLLLEVGLYSYELSFCNCFCYIS